jgi:two-component sensor histidine kinase
MATHLDPQSALKRHLILAILGVVTIGAAIATLLHRLETKSHLINLIAPPLLAILSLALLIYLYKVPQRLQSVIHLGLINSVLFMVLPCWWFTLEAFISPAQTLVDRLPPLMSGLFLLTTVMMITLRPRYLLGATLSTWGAIAAPVLIYLLLHPDELNSLRGLDFVIALGPGMGVQIVLLLFFNRLQDFVDRLYQERLQYYEKIIERQTIRQRAMEHAVTQIHNGPLQTLALLMREVQRGSMPPPELFQRLTDLNTEIRAVGQSLTDETLPAPSTAHFDFNRDSTQSEHLLRLGEGSSIDLNYPLHNLFHEVYALTLKRNLPHFQTIKVKVRNFAASEPSYLALELKRDLCLWLEEALCNVGKHAEGATRLVVTGQQETDHYLLQVQDNGSGIAESGIAESGIAGSGIAGLASALDAGQQGTKFCKLLAERLGGTFQRISLPQGGVMCSLSIPKSAIVADQI